MTKSILVVDDNKICNFLTVNALKKAGGFGDIERNTAVSRFNTFRY